jgi:hypothetical protein
MLNRLCAGRRGFRFPAEESYSSAVQNAQSGSGFHSASSLVDISFFSLVQSVRDVKLTTSFHHKAWPEIYQAYCDRGSAYVLQILRSLT